MQAVSTLQVGSLKEKVIHYFQVSGDFLAEGPTDGRGSAGPACPLPAPPTAEALPEAEGRGACA